MRELLLALLLLTAVHAAQAEALLIDTGQSDAGFALRALLVKRIEGSFSRVEGVIERQPGGARFDVDVRIAADSVRMDKEDHARWARSADFFDAARHPWIQFRAADISERVLHEGGEILGELTLRGITRRVGFAVEPGECPRPGIDCVVRARGEVQRGDFGMDARRIVLGDRVRIDFSIRTHDHGASPAATDAG